MIAGFKISGRTKATCSKANLITENESTDRYAQIEERGMAAMILGFSRVLFPQCTVSQDQQQDK